MGAICMKAKKNQSMMRKTSWKRYLGQYWQFYAMLIVPLAYFILFKYVPMFGNILAFRRFRPLTGPYGVSWVGLRYFKQFLGQPQFWNAFRNTLTLSAINLAVNFPIPILFAILLNELQSLKFKKLVQTVSYMPRFISTVVVISILTELLSPSSGMITRLLKNTFGIEPIYYMNEPEYFRFLYVLTDAWQYTGWTAIVYLAAITGISSDMFEAARIDGANSIKILFYVTIPNIKNSLALCALLRTIDSFRLFDKVNLLTGGGPANSTAPITQYLYNYGIKSLDFGFGSAGAIVMTIMVLILSSVYIKRAIK